jgi:hypothetical protein
LAQAIRQDKQRRATGPALFASRLRSCPPADERKVDPMTPRNTALENFLGGSPISVVTRLFFVSLVVGALLMWLELRPMDVLRGVQAFFERIYQLGFGAVKELASYVLAGAVFVVPAWFVLRLMTMSGRGR